MDVVRRFWVVIIDMNVKAWPVDNLCKLANPCCLPYINKDKSFNLNEMELRPFKKIPQILFKGAGKGKDSVRIEFFCSQHGCQSIKVCIYVGCNDLHGRKISFKAMLAYIMEVNKELHQRQFRLKNCQDARHS